MRQSTIKRVKLSEISTDGPILHPVLTGEQERRIRVIHETFQEVFPVTLEETRLNFQRDMRIEQELRIWERWVSLWKARVGKYPTLEGRKAFFKMLMSGGETVS